MAIPGLPFFSPSSTRETHLISDQIFGGFPKRALLAPKADKTSIHAYPGGVPGWVLPQRPRQDRRGASEPGFTLLFDDGLNSLPESLYFKLVGRPV